MNLYLTEQPHPDESGSQSEAPRSISEIVDKINQVLETLADHYQQDLEYYEALVDTDYTQDKLEKMGMRDYECASDMLHKIAQLRGVVKKFRTVQAELIAIGFKKMMTEEEMTSDLDPAETELNTLMYYVSYHEFKLIVNQVGSLLQSVTQYSRHYDVTQVSVPSLDAEFTQLSLALFGEITESPRKRRKRNR